jgi:hypothetical protein
VEISQEQFDKLGAIIDAKHRHAYRMAALLRELQWGDRGWCIVCDMIDPADTTCKGEGHTADCRLDAILREWDASGPPT